MANAKKVPAAPKKDPAMGEKTPEYVKWLKANRPEEYKSKFANWKNR